MVLTDDDKKRLEGQFDHFCKTVLVNSAKNYRRQKNRQSQREVFIDDLSMNEFAQLSAEDEYPALYDELRVLDYIVYIRHELLFQALKILPDSKRKILFMSYWLEMTDEEISQTLCMVRRTVNYIRRSSLKMIKKFLEDKGLEP